MQGQGMSGERRPVCEGRTHWRDGDKVMDGGSNETPRRGGVLNDRWLNGYRPDGQPVLMS